MVLAGRTILSVEHKLRREWTLRIRWLHNRVYFQCGDRHGSPDRGLASTMQAIHSLGARDRCAATGQFWSAGTLYADCNGALCPVDRPSPIGGDDAANVGVAHREFRSSRFALKPHFALVPILLETWLRRSLIRPETLALVFLGSAYGAAVFLLERDYFTTALPLISSAYGQFSKFRFTDLVPTLIPFVVALSVPARGESARALLVASLAFYLVFVFQMKGFAYQAIPTMGMLALSSAASAPRSTPVHRTLAFVTALFAILPNLVPYRTPAWANVPAGSSYAALSVAPRAGWPLVEERRLTWPLRSMSLWMAPALGDAIKPWVIKDLQCNAPLYLLVDDRRVNFTAMLPSIISHYVPVERRGRVVLMKRATRMQLPNGCRTIY